jgi:hypothetical protein
VSTDVFVAENVRICLRRIAELLTTDQRGPTPHLCVAFAATSRLLVMVARVSTAFNTDAITHEALGVCSILIESEEEAFLEDKAFADALPDFVESIQRSVRSLGDTDAESAMVEVLFGIAAKLRIEPHVLRVWFRPEKPDDDDEELSDSERRTRFEEFPLFYLLLHYVPREGRSGEFARMGLLYIIETTAHSEDLEQWIVEGDMSALMASGLGALYSQLGRKLAMAYETDKVPSILTFSARINQDPAPDAELTTSRQYQVPLTTFLSSLVFWQDLLEHCASADVRQTLLDHFQYLFLQQLLYPSLLESSDVDGGSAVAVLTYLRHILESIEHPDLVRLTLQYLFGQQSPAPEPATNRPIANLRRRKSASLMARLATEEEQFSPDLFNLTDLITSSLRSKSQQTVAATLQLLSTMLRRPHHQAFPNFLKTRVIRSGSERRSVGGQEKEVDIFLGLAENLAGFQNLESSYEKHLHDNRNILESHPCSVQLLHLTSVAPAARDTTDSNFEALEQRQLLVEDPILRSLMSLLDRFFQNDIETNLGLTQAIIDLASCGYLGIEGWLVTHPSKYRFSEKDVEFIKEAESFPGETDDAKLLKINLSRREPVWDAEDTSPAQKALNSLILEAESYQREIQDFDTLLMDCRRSIEEEENDVASSTGATLLKLPESGRSSPTRTLGTSQVDSIGARLKSDRAYGGDSSSDSPRGRPLDMSPIPTLVGRTSHLQLSPTRSPSDVKFRTYSPSPLRGMDKLSSTPSRPSSQLRKASDALSKRIRVVSGLSTMASQHPDTSESETSSLQSEVVEPPKKGSDVDEIPIGQLLTNVIILQEFILELAALIEVRATLFREVKYL